MPIDLPTQWLPSPVPFIPRSLAILNPEAWAAQQMMPQIAPQWLLQPPSELDWALAAGALGAMPPVIPAAPDYIEPFPAPAMPPQMAGAPLIPYPQYTIPMPEAPIPGPVAVPVIGPGGEQLLPIPPVPETVGPPLPPPGFMPTPGPVPELAPIPPAPPVFPGAPPAYPIPPIAPPPIPEPMPVLAPVPPPLLPAPQPPTPQPPAPAPQPSDAITEEQMKALTRLAKDLNYPLPFFPTMTQQDGADLIRMWQKELNQRRRTEKAETPAP